MSILDDVKARLDDEADYAYADFNEYKREVLLSEEDEEPFDDFRYGMRRALAIVNGMLQGVTIIPNEATNGDMIKAMFNVEIKHIFEDLIVVILDGKSKIFELDWWNAPYKKRE